jgi:phosphatidylglycerophosphatase A
MGELLKTREQICIELLNHAMKFDANEKVVDEITALELASVIIPYISICPVCNTENFENKKCWLCNVGSLFLQNIDKKIEN